MLRSCTIIIVRRHLREGLVVNTLIVAATTQTPQAAGLGGSLWLQFGVSLGVMFLGILLAFLYENRGAPYLSITAIETADYVAEGGHRVRFPHLKVTNVRRWAPLVTKRTAADAHGWMTFHNEQGQQVGGRVPIRWNGAPQPLSPHVENGKLKSIFDHRFLRAGRYIDIPPGETETLSPAVRLFNERSAWCWTGDSYKHDWRHPKLELLPGRYTVHVHIKTGDRPFDQEFHLLNPEEFEGFRLEEEAPGGVT